jgi:hypothetical protein
MKGKSMRKFAYPTGWIMSILTAVFVMATAFTGCATIGQSEQMEFTAGTVAMYAGYELRDQFEWTDEVECYYRAIMDGELTLDAAKLVEAYLYERYPDIVANRLIKLASMVGFDLNELNQITSIENVDMGLLKVAASEFRAGLNMD